MQEPDNSGNVRLERQVRLTLTEDEYKTMMTALHDHGHYCLDAADRLSQRGIKHPFTGDPLEGALLAQKCGNRAFDLKGRLQKEWEEA